MKIISSDGQLSIDNMDVALAKLELLEKQGCKVEESEVSDADNNNITRMDRD